MDPDNITEISDTIENFQEKVSDLIKLMLIIWKILKL